MNDFAGKLENFWNVFMNAGGYREVLKGLQNTLTIAVLGLLIGIVIGTVIAAVRVLPKYKRLPRVLNSICGFYVGLFRGTPMVVQLLVFYYVLLPLLGVTRLPSVTVATLVLASTAARTSPKSCARASCPSTAGRWRAAARSA